MTDRSSRALLVFYGLTLAGGVIGQIYGNGWCIVGLLIGGVCAGIIGHFDWEKRP